MNLSSVKKILEGERLPAALVDVDAFDRNLERAVAVLGANPAKKTIRIASKSVRVVELLRRAINRGVPVQGLMTYSAYETLFLASDGFDDLLMGYPVIAKEELAALREAHRHGKRVMAMVDSAEHVNALAHAMNDVSRPFKVVIDLDASLRILGNHIGVRRSPLRTPDDVVQIAKLIRGHPQLEFEGIMSYEAHIAGVGDVNPFSRLKNGIKHWMRVFGKKRIAALRKATVKRLEAEGFPCRLVNGGGTGSANWTAEESVVTEVTVGSGLLCGHLFDYYSNIRWEPAAYFVLPSVRSPGRQMLTCFGGGYIASGEPGWDKVPVPADPTHSLISLEGCGEVQTPIRFPKGRAELGDPIFFRHAKSGELAERFNEYILIQTGRAMGRAKTYRGAGQCFG